MRSFKHFPKEKQCPLCGTNKDKECILIPIDGTEDEDAMICEAEPTHSSCLLNNVWRINKEAGCIYTLVKD